MLKRIAANRPSPAMLVALIALFVALGGTSIAAFKLKANSVGSKQIKPNAATGADVNESSLAKVPSAASADNANDALHSASSDAVGGFTSDELVVGNGIQFAGAGTPDDGQGAGFAFGAGTLVLRCSPTPVLRWEDDADDGPSDPPTDIWTSEGGHKTVVDGTPLTTLDTDTTAMDADMTVTGQTQAVEIWTGGDSVLSLQVSSQWDVAATECNVAMFLNAEPNNLLDAIASGSRKTDSGERPTARWFSGS